MNLNKNRKNYINTNEVKGVNESPSGTLHIKQSGTFKALELHGRWWKCVEFNIRAPIDQYGLLKTILGMDIWYGNIPFCKTVLLANIIAWLLFIK